MSGFGSIRSEVDPGPGEKKLEAARLVVCNHAIDVDDAALLLRILGLLDGPDRQHREGPRE